ncbi:helix-turn-helix domain-containing protein [Dyadobacter sp. CY261]|uniref:helix-turn-helix domain-containing protein n=1 Tax=Dyadobacter sp. CY261 TaxID=2907203 RepID=UPI001F409178|nr:helix-turn-helix domain-containing protein [Dyadobacter sp. CY261]MCF0074428.1 helix-turn-helix domain-containing protein [Dyadobacter sp. CY261]
MNKQTTSDQIRTLRKSKGLSQEALAEMAGINLRTLQRIEAGDAVPRGETLRLLAQALGVPVETLSPAPDPAPIAAFEDPGILKLLNLSALSFWFIPFGNILIPFALWMYKRNTVAGVSELGKRILNFQITWSLAVYGITFVGMMSGILNVLISPMAVLCVIFALLIINTIIIISTHFKLNRGEEAVYDPSFKIIS